MPIKFRAKGKDRKFSSFDTAVAFVVRWKGWAKKKARAYVAGIENRINPRWRYRGRG